MIARAFRSVVWVAAVGGAALGCYMVSLQVATERNDLLRVEREIIAAKQDIRTLQTEIGTRGRLSQLEHWNAEVLALSAPSSAQFMESAFTLARLEQHEPGLGERAAEVRMASLDTAPAAAAPARPAAPPVVQAVAPAAPAAPPALIHRASFVSAADAPVAETKKPDAEPKPKPKPKPKAEPRAPRLDGGLAAEIGAAARVEASDTAGGN